jgi:hypothetical protein
MEYTIKIAPRIVAQGTEAWRDGAVMDELEVVEAGAAGGGAGNTHLFYPKIGGLKRL